MFSSKGKADTKLVFQVTEKEMKTIKINQAITRLVLVLLVSGMFAQSAEAQRRSRGGDQVKELDRRLELSDDQKTQIQKIMDDAKESAKSTRENVQAQIDAVLSDEQKAKRSELQESRKDRNQNFRARGKRGRKAVRGNKFRGRSRASMNRRGRSHRAVNRGNRVVDMRRELRGIDLSDEQKESLKSLREEQREMLKSAKEEVTSAANDRRAAMKEQAEQYKAKVEALLTDEQKAKLKENREKRSSKGNRRGRRGR